MNMTLAQTMVVCFTVILVVGMTYSHLQRRWARDDHEHHWVNVSCQTGYQRPTDAVGMYMDQTVILQRCRCGEHDTEFIDGNWTRDELGINDETVQELLELLNEITPDASDTT